MLTKILLLTIFVYNLVRESIISTDKKVSSYVQSSNTYWLSGILVIVWSLLCSFNLTQHVNFFLPTIIVTSSTWLSLHQTPLSHHLCLYHLCLYLIFSRPIISPFLLNCLSNQHHYLLLHLTRFSIWRRYEQELGVLFFMTHGVYTETECYRINCRIQVE